MQVATARGFRGKEKFHGKEERALEIASTAMARRFFVGRRIPENLYGARFNFTSADKTLRSGQLSVPSLADVGEDFIDKYLRFAVQRLQKMSADGKLKFRISEVR